MAGAAEGNVSIRIIWSILTIPSGPTYLSPRSADVILSDIRPTKFNIEALCCTNVLLDEFLYSVLNAARSLTPHQLRAGLLKVLPTTLGKEALLEAEMELRAYLERTGVSAASVEVEEKGNDFNLQWSFEVRFLFEWAVFMIPDIVFGSSCVSSVRHIPPLAIQTRTRRPRHG